MGLTKTTDDCLWVLNQEINLIQQILINSSFTVFTIQNLCNLFLDFCSTKIVINNDISHFQLGNIIINRGGIKFNRFWVKRSMPICDSTCCKGIKLERDFLIFQDGHNPANWACEPKIIPPHSFREIKRINPIRKEVFQNIRSRTSLLQFCHSDIFTTRCFDNTEIICINSLRFCKACGGFSWITFSIIGCFLGGAGYFNRLIRLQCLKITNRQSKSSRSPHYSQFPK